MKKRIAVEQLRMGMYLHELCGPWLQHPFWRTRFLLKDPSDIERIRTAGIREVWIDLSKGRDIESDLPRAALIEEPASSPIPADVGAATPLEAIPLAQEIRHAAEICRRGRDDIHSLFQQVRMGRAVEIQRAVSLVEEVSASVLRNPSALASLARLRAIADYTYMHSLAVCALMIVVARRLGLDDSQCREAGMAGLLHDLGKAEVPAAILNKPYRLDEREKAVIRTHTTKGYQILLENPDIGDMVREVCLRHHEKMDGTGYPGGLGGDQLSLVVRISTVCDVYDAITSNRPYKDGWDPAESIRRMAQWQGHFDERVLHAFVKSLGIYPVGSVVRLESGRLGVVYEQSESSLLTPRVKAFFSAKANAYITPELVDLSQPGNQDRITGHADPAHWGIRNVDRYWVQDSFRPS